ncbi:Translation initiation factor eIF-2B subunit beta [Eumeta japonica]|uniref:Translation initiation factor eIF2B subunit beta n=1 Tax=Eumeta variegata TaxID=151549 RepID=A0A4C1VC53_EUMVA|nr:Translation initiation factor eIF-2B subunit beta [Eumeta japonica]
MSPLSGVQNVMELDEKYHTRIVQFVSKINTGKLEGSCSIALATLTFLEQIVNDTILPSTDDLKEEREQEDLVRKQVSSAVGVIREVGKRLRQALPGEHVVSNIVCRVLRILRDVARNKSEGSADGGDSLQRLVRGGTTPGDACDPNDHGGLRSLTLGYIDELRNELESSASAIEELSGEQIHAQELILTVGASRLVERFLKKAFTMRPFNLVVVGCGRPARTHAMAGRLSTAGIPVTVVGASHAAAVMARANKCVLGVRAVLAGGALLTIAGSHAVALAAEHHSVPLVALAPLYKLAPTYANGARAAHSLGPPHIALPYECDPGGEAYAYAPLYDHVPPDLVTLFVTNQFRFMGRGHSVCSSGAFSPSYIYRQLSELYDPSDYQL